jgi:hypothetical protein
VALAAFAGLQVGATAFDRPQAAHLPILGIPLGVPSPPSGDDWRHREILALVAADSGGRAATVSVVPNHPFFSVSNFRYYAVRDGLPFEFSRAWDGTPLGVEYAILKTGDVGPPWTEGRIRRVTASLDEPSGPGILFPVIGRFGLPDGSEAIVRARRLKPVPGASSAEVAAAAERAFARWISDFARDVEGGSLRLRYDAGAREGRIAEVALSAERVTFAEFRRPRAARLQMRGVLVAVEDVVINPFSAVEQGRLELLDVGRLRLERGTITADDLARFLGELPKFKAQVALQPGALAVAVHQFGPDITGRVRVVPVPAAPLPVSLVPEDVRIGAVAVPDTVVGWVMRQYDPTGRIARRLAMPVTMGRIAVEPGAVTIGAGP